MNTQGRRRGRKARVSGVVYEEQTRSAISRDRVEWTGTRDSLFAPVCLYLYIYLRPHPDTHYLRDALITPPPFPSARLIRLLPSKSSPKNGYTEHKAARIRITDDDCIW